MRYTAVLALHCTALTLHAGGVAGMRGPHGLAFCGLASLKRLAAGATAPGRRHAATCSLRGGSTQADGGFPAPVDGKRVCGYLTDVEGNYEYFERYVAASKVLSWGKDQRLQLRDDAEFVFGGDSVDKGTGDIRFVRHLIDLKDRYPDRVTLLIGNRDANKLRLSSELSAEAMESEAVASDVSFPYWLPEGTAVPPKQYLQKHGLSDTRTSRLKWILAETMGADGAFERRRIELAGLIGKEEGEVTDDDVVESYLHSVDPSRGDEAFMLRYLQRGVIAHTFGNTLFVHGGVSEQAAGWIPGASAPVGSVAEWVQGLNAWCAAEVAAFEQNPFEGLNTKERAGHGLMDYGVPGGETSLFVTSVGISAISCA